MTSNTSLSLQRSGLADGSALQSLRTEAAQDPKKAAREAARQFEAMFMQQMLKQMRETAQSDELTGGGEGGKLATEMLDGQYAQDLAGRPGSLTDVIARQLERQMSVQGSPIPSTARANRTPVELGSISRPVAIPQNAAAGFVQQHTQAAQAAEQRSGIPAEFMISQAALETGWGRKEILHADGSTSHNLFGIKAGPGWKGPVAEVMTTEYENGRAVKKVQAFRAYASYAESFQDYARLITNSPRYAPVVAAADDAAAFARGLQRAGYATDPAYADKLTGVINTTLRLQGGG